MDRTGLPPRTLRTVVRLKRASRWRTAELPEVEDVPGYRDLEPLGPGATSLVYRAVQDGTERIVTLKIISLDGIDPPARRAFLRAAHRATGLADTPGVVGLLGCGLTTW